MRHQAAPLRNSNRTPISPSTQYHDIALTFASSTNDVTMSLIYPAIFSVAVDRKLEYSTSKARVHLSMITDPACHRTLTIVRRSTKSPFPTTEDCDLKHTVQTKLQRHRRYHGTDQAREVRQSPDSHLQRHAIAITAELIFHYLTRGPFQVTPVIACP